MTKTGPLKGRRVLVVEDQYLLATDVCELLVEAGAEVLGPVPDSYSACRLIDEERPDNAVVDIDLGEGPTYEVASRLAERRVPFLFATGYGAKILKPPHSGTPTLQKPFQIADLERMIGVLGTG